MSSAPGTGGRARLNVLILAIGVGLSQAGAAMVVTVAALVGYVLAPDKSLATLPFALTVTGTMVATIPASLFMGRVGRRIGFTVGQMIGIAGASLVVYAIFLESFYLLMAGSFLFGMHNAFWQYYRFAAAETATDAFKSRAISYVLAGGVIAALAGPELAKYGRELLEVMYAGVYAVIVVLCLITIVLLQFIRIPRPVRKKGAGSGRPLIEIARQPVFIVAVLSAMLGYAGMVLVMTATPLSMVDCGFDFSAAAFVIEWHILGMTVPSFFTGHLIRRFGVMRIIFTGALFYAACMVINMMGIGEINFWTSLVFLGVGWNFMYVGGTTLVTEAYVPEERFKVQALNDFLVFGLVAIASFSSGAIYHLFGWTEVNFVLLLPVTVSLISLFWLKSVRRRAVA
ncbi:MAG: MFS transporter [Rhodospirillales bacterium]|nr:MFS transporter [Rhodospirillales bacterium]